MLSVCLFQLLGAKTHVSIKAGEFCALGSTQNATFWKKLCFGPRLKMRWEHANLMECRRSINQKAHAHWNYPWGWLINYQITLIKSPHQFSRLKFTLTPLISSLYSPFALKLTLMPLISSLCSALSVVSLSALSFVESSSSSSSFFCLLQRALICIFFF